MLQHLYLNLKQAINKILNIKSCSFLYGKINIIVKERYE